MVAQEPEVPVLPAERGFDPLEERGSDPRVLEVTGCHPLLLPPKELDPEQVPILLAAQVPLEELRQVLGLVRML